MGVGTSQEEPVSGPGDQQQQTEPALGDLSDEQSLDALHSPLKIVLMGEGGTGKTQLLRRYVHNVFQDLYKSTIGVEFALKKVPVGGVGTPEGPQIALQLWDIAGQERFGNMVTFCLPISRSTFSGPSGFTRVSAFPYFFCV
jgi:GTPase SAR1 family protein